jgi:CheY-like chemotaxis protein
MITTGSERILLVDDGGFQVDLGKQMLKRLGYKVTAIIDSIGALELFRF